MVDKTSRCKKILGSDRKEKKMIGTILSLLAVGIIGALIFMVVKTLKTEWFQVDVSCKWADCAAIAKALGVQLATVADIQTAYDKGAELCRAGFALKKKGDDPSKKESWCMAYPIQTARTACGTKGVNVWQGIGATGAFNAVGNKPKNTPADLKKYVAILSSMKGKEVISYKPAVFTAWNPKLWSRYSEKA
jgi:hypothetical protein